MARSLYGGRLGDTVVSLLSIGSRRVLALPVDAIGDPTATTLEVWDEPDGVHLTDLLAADGTTPIASVTVPSTGQIPAFFGPDGYGDGLWLRDPDGDFYRLEAKGAAGPAGSTGPAGRSVTSIARTSGTGAPGTTDTYTITYSDATTSTFTVYNGSNGTGTGDVVGPASSVDLRLAVFSGTTGKLLAQGSNTVGGVLSRANHTGTQAASTITGLGTAATVNTGTTSGTIPLLGASGTLAVARLATGTPDGTKFVADDGTLKTPAGGGGSGLLASVAYNPAAVTNVTNSTATYTDVDATNLILPTFTVPASGAVIFVLTARVASTNATNPALWGLGVAGTVVAASTARVSVGTTIARVVHRVKITGLTPGATSSAYRWMHANAATASTTTTYGGTGTTAEGQALMEVWSA